MENKLTKLFQDYCDGKLSPSEVSEMKKSILKADDSLIEKSLEEIWSNYTDAIYHHQYAYNKILNNLKEIIGKRQKKHVTFVQIWKTAAAVMLPFVLGASAYLFVENKTLNQVVSQDCIIKTDKGERSSLILPDGTSVLLNSNSTLNYPASFGLNSRRVSLTGEAYFEVAENKKIPFIVSTSDLDIKVRGTVFNVYSYSTDSVFETSLVKGKVEIFNRMSKKSVLLFPNQKACYNSITGQLRVVETDLTLETAWKRKELIFRSEQLPAIFAKLESFYGKNIHIKGDCPKELFTGNFKEEDIGLILKNLQLHYQFTYTKTGDDINIKF